MELIWEFIQFIFYAGLIVIISKYMLVTILRKLAESLNLKPKTVGNIAGIATSAPELLTVSFSAFTGLVSASVYNIISSNIINTVQYLISIYLHKNQKELKNRAIKIDFIMAILTIIIPIILVITKIKFSIAIVPIFILLFLLFYFINANSHKLYLNIVTEQDKQIEQETKWLKGKKRKIAKYTILLLIVAILLYVVGNLLSNNLESLCIKFQMPQFVIGVLLGFITSIPELITFFESQKHHKNEENELDGVVEATNNLLTSNILNLFIIQSVGIVIYTLVK